ncbi:CAP domain-containing protein [Streptomyces laurentii]|uniref:CAP domain-containing protein n=1 Tax=Streptomyces laurentii TaxID=39478 RepID=UPI0036B15193
MGRHRGIRRGAPVKTGLLGVSVAVVAGAIAVATGLLPGGDVFTFGETSADGRQARAEQAPRLTTQGGASANTENPAGQRTGGPVTSGTGAATPAAPPAPKAPAAPAKPAPAKSSPTTTAAPKPTPTPKPKPVAPKTAAPKTSAPKVPAAAPTRTPAAPKPVAPAPKPAPKPVPQPTKTSQPSQPSQPAPKPVTPAPTATTRPLSVREAAAEAEVVRLVNVERAKVGCSAVRSNTDLASLAGALSADMAARNFFDHTDPDGATPWARAAKAGVTGLGAENIARGQVDAAAVMASWMASDGHRANILNCTYTSLGVGVHFGSGGPWWTQDFGL